jgi:hypothetical protein
MSPDQAQSTKAAASQAPSAPGLRLVPAPYAFLLSLATVVILFVGLLAVPDHGPRGAEDSRWTLADALALLPAAYLLLWIAYSGWRNRRGFRAWGRGRRILRGLRIVLQPVVWFLAVLIPMAFTLPGGQTVRGKNSEMILAMSGVRAAVTGRAEANNTLAGSGAGLAIAPSGRVTADLVGRDGAVVVYNGEFRMLATLLPAMHGEWVTWTCDALPPKYFPSSCGAADGGTSYALRGSGSPQEDAFDLLDHAAAWQRQVASSALARGTLEGSARTTVVRREGLVDFALLDSNGRMALYSDRHGTFALLEPRLEKGQVTWRCRIWPATAASSGCAASR